MVTNIKNAADGSNAADGVNVTESLDAVMETLDVIATEVREKYDVVVCGGGLAGFSAALAAARLGATTCLIHNRPVLGGCASSEVRVEPRGSACFHAYSRESGIVHDLMIEDRHRNHQDVFESGWANSVWDMGMYDMAMQEHNLTLKLNTTVVSVEMEGDSISAVRCHTPPEEKVTVVYGKRFVDCTGDGIVAVGAGCSWRRGEEARTEFGEPHAPIESSDKTMGNSLLFKTVDTGRPSPFVLPEWAVEFDDEEFFDHQGRVLYDTRGGFWWIELGDPWDVITDGESLRHELTRRVLGVWDWMKNKDPRYIEKTRNLAIDWIGQVPGMRESRRIEGMYLLKEDDIRKNRVFPDEVAYGGWNIDLHTVGGMLADSSEPTALAGSEDKGGVAAAAYVGPFGVPLRSLIAREVSNLAFAGRIVSATHVALGSVRVMGTTAIIGQAAGTAVAVSLNENIPLREVPRSAIGTVQQQLLRDGCFLPNISNQDSADIARSARITASSFDLYDGAGIDDSWVSGGVSVTDMAIHRASLVQPLSQWIPVGRGDRARGVEKISFALSNESKATARIHLRLVAVSGIWDYSDDGAGVLAESTREVAEGLCSLEWETGLSACDLESAMEDIAAASGYVRFEVSVMNDGTGIAAEETGRQLFWLPSHRIQPGAMAGYQMKSGGLHRLYDGVTLNHHIVPEQEVYVPEEVISGIARPQRTVAAWRSAQDDPSAVLELAWTQQQTVAQVHLTFPGHLAWEFDRYPSFFEDPQIPKDYDLETFSEGRWVKQLEVHGNYQTHRIHTFAQPSVTSRLRIVFHATNGDPSASVYEVRCYSTMSNMGAEAM